MKQKSEFCATPPIALMRTFVRQFPSRIHFRTGRTLMVLGVDEACTNIIRHAYHLRDDN